MNNVNLPIIACSTSTKEDSAVAIIRISGEIQLDLFLPFFNIKKKK